MATNLPAMKGQFGSTEYFLCMMRTGELVNTLTPKEMDGWQNLDMTERFQREINYKRVKEQIAPYMADDPDNSLAHS